MDWGVFIFFLNNVCLLEDAYYEANWMRTISNEKISQRDIFVICKVWSHGGVIASHENKWHIIILIIDYSNFGLKKSIVISHEYNCLINNLFAICLEFEQIHYTFVQAP
jgi:hypothetical protein